MRAVLPGSFLRLLMVLLFVATPHAGAQALSAEMLCADLTNGVHHLARACSDAVAMTANQRPATSSGWSLVLEAMPWEKRLEADLAFVDGQGQVVASRGSFSGWNTLGGQLSTEGVHLVVTEGQDGGILVVRRLGEEIGSPGFAAYMPLARLLAFDGSSMESVHGMILMPREMKKMWSSASALPEGLFGAGLSHRPTFRVIERALKAGQGDAIIYRLVDPETGRIHARRINWTTCMVGTNRVATLIDEEIPVPDMGEGDLTGYWSGAYSERLPESVARRDSSDIPEAGQLNAAIVQDGGWFSLSASGGTWAMRAEGVYTNGLFSAASRFSLEDGNRATWYWQAQYDAEADTVRGVSFGNAATRVAERSFFLRRLDTVNDEVSARP